MSLKANIRSLKKLNNILVGIDWKLVGGTNLAIQQVKAISHDIDIILIRDDDINEVNERLAGYVIRPIAFSKNGVYESFFGQFVIDGVQIDIMANMVINEHRIKTVYAPVIINVEGARITCASLAEEYTVAVLRGKEQVANMIRKYMANVG